MRYVDEAYLDDGDMEDQARLRYQKKKQQMVKSNLLEKLLCPCKQDILISEFNSKDVEVSQHQNVEEQ
ncbi:hypothetical protein MPTK1_5g06700 [Marchantia polymorpha subsp. ruderalis]|uniref:Uncharacterized protein n=2 Tax=Marchantia polymorpha TaxID=3197 RepID=A0AAF6BFN7_MARPO|nr:hypothetical protein MARPO_0171s0013 [Marchantia polymorpha]BBN10821.1 hypothetical protein Mp_5g06700 [Marchantia polymorpha subsp. ruderalis]|eukprot:PTQ28171.1 hypothetical protein MARPO_0171s0013 [Marchantia polymorpha]